MGVPGLATSPRGNPRVVDLWPGSAPEESATLGAETYPMSPKLDRKQVEVTEPTRMITGVTRPTLTIYRPAKDKDTGTAMLICPGGGYWNLYWELEGEEVAAWVNSLGVTGILLKYRVPRRPDEPKGEPARRPLQDAQRAVSLVRSRAREWGLSPQRIGMVGFSAGGHLAIATATSFDQRTYQPIDHVDNLSCRPDFAVLVYPGYLKAKDKQLVAQSQVLKEQVPAGFQSRYGEVKPASQPTNHALEDSRKRLKTPVLSTRMRFLPTTGGMFISESAMKALRTPTSLDGYWMGCSWAKSHPHFSPPLRRSVALPPHSPHTIPSTRRFPWF